MKSASQKWYAARKKDRHVAMSGEMMCKKCSMVKEVTEFGTHPNMTNGRRTTCKKCRSAETVDWFNNRGGKKFRTIEKKRQYKATQKERYPERVKARSTSSNAIAMRKLIAKDVCGRCNSRGPTQGHHPDYSKPLEVEWLCISCHIKEHTVKEK